MVSSNATRPLGPQGPSASQPSSSPSSSRPISPREPSSMTPCVGASSQPNSSVPPSSQSTESTQPTKKIVKHHIIVKTTGAVVGENQARWKSRSGHFIRAHIPLRYHDWRIVPKTFKNDVWNALLGEFEFNIKPDAARPLLEREFSQRFRTAKNIYRREILVDKTREEALAACPEGLDLGHWERFVANEYSPKMVAKKAKNSANRKCNTIEHTNGRQSYAQVHHNEQLKNPHQKIGRAHTWKKGHEHADGTVLESARVKYDEVTAAQERRDIDMNGDSNDNQLDINSDEIFEVFGPDSGNHVRGVGSHIPRKHLQHVAVATEILEQESSKSVAKVEADVCEVKASVTTMQGVLTAIFQQLTNIGAGCSQSSPTINTRTSDLGSNVVRDPSPTMPPYFPPSTTMPPYFPPSTTMPPYFPEVNTSSSSPKVTSSPQKVTLLDRKGEPVAKGYIVTDGTSGICHGRKVISGEKKVFVEDVLDPDAHIYDGPQNGEYTLEALVEGGFLIWLEGLLQLS